MDLRVRKTRRSIRDAFIELRADKPLEKITVKELCERAEINKTTFYLHYQSIYDLSEALENELIEECFANIPDGDIKNTEKVVLEFYKVFSEKSEYFRILFSDSRIEYVAEKAHDFLRERIYRTYPKLKTDMEFSVRLTVAMYGSFYAYLAYKNEDVGTIMQCIAKIATEILAVDKAKIDG